MEKLVKFLLAECGGKSFEDVENSVAAFLRTVAFGDAPQDLLGFHGAQSRLAHVATCVAQLREHLVCTEKMIVCVQEEVAAIGGAECAIPAAADEVEVDAVSEAPPPPPGHLFLKACAVRKPKNSAKNNDEVKPECVRCIAIGSKTGKPCENLVTALKAKIDEDKLIYTFETSFAETANFYSNCGSLLPEPERSMFWFCGNHKSANQKIAYDTLPRRYEEFCKLAEVPVDQLLLEKLQKPPISSKRGGSGGSGGASASATADNIGDGLLDVPKKTETRGRKKKPVATKKRSIPTRQARKKAVKKRRSEEDDDDEDGSAEESGSSSNLAADDDDDEENLAAGLVPAVFESDPAEVENMEEEEEAVLDKEDVLNVDRFLEEKGYTKIPIQSFDLLLQEEHSPFPDGSQVFLDDTQRCICVVCNIVDVDEEDALDKLQLYIGCYGEKYTGIQMNASQRSPWDEGTRWTPCEQKIFEEAGLDEARAESVMSFLEQRALKVLKVHK